MAGITTVGACSAATLIWRHLGTLHLSVVVKATFSFRRDEPMARAEPLPVRAEDVHHRGQPLSHLVAINDLVPYRPKADVILDGCAHAPGGQPAEACAVRLGLFRGDEPLVDKLLRVYGDRRGGALVPFTRMPLGWERAWGGAGDVDNPGGTGASRGDPLPNVVYPDGGRRMAGFGGLPAAFGPRTRRAHPDLPQRFGRGVAELPEGLDWSFFQASPEDQQAPYLRGDEWLVLLHLHRAAALYRTQLPAAQARGVIFGLGERDAGEARPLSFHADTLFVEPEEDRASIVWRTAIPVASESAAEAVAIVVGVGSHGEEPAFPAARPVPAASAKVERDAPAEVEGTLLLTDSGAAAAAARPAAPFAIAEPRKGQAPSAPIPGAPWADRAASPALPQAWTDVEATIGFADVRAALDRGSPEGTRVEAAAPPVSITANPAASPAPPAVSAAAPAQIAAAPASAPPAPAPITSGSPWAPQEPERAAEPPRPAPLRPAPPRKIDIAAALYPRRKG
jgi:hypothetical protein